MKPLSFPRHSWIFRAGLLALLLLCGGCAHAISESLRQSVDPHLLFSQLSENPEAYVGKKVMLGGTIVETRNLENVSEIEVIQKELDFQGYPELGNYSGGRFLFHRKGYLESEIYSNGRAITGAGTVTGSKLGKIGEQEYRFPVIEAEELFLWEEYLRHPYYYPPYWDPFYHPHFYSPHHPFYW